MNIYENIELLPPDLQGWNGRADIFGKLIQQTNPMNIIEVGTWKGQSAITMGKEIKLRAINTAIDTAKREGFAFIHKTTKIFCVDTWLGALEFMGGTGDRDLMLKNGYPQVYYQFLSNVVHNNCQDIIIPVPQTSTIAARWFRKQAIEAELIYIDGSHDEPDVYDDLCNYYDLCTGVIFGDDWRHFADVERAVTRFCKERNITFEVVDDNFWVIKKQ